MKKLWLPIVVVLLALVAGGVYALLYRPVAEAYDAAMAASEPTFCTTQPTSIGSPPAITLRPVRA